MAFVHWVDVRGPNTSLGGSLIISLPLIFFLVIGLLRAATETGRGRIEQQSVAGGVAQLQQPAPRSG
jgi:hypothetical protein